MTKKVAVVQSNYIPWKGYFDLIAAVDEFVLYDDMQYTRRDWRNRNRIKTPQGLQWLTVPVKVRGKYLQAIKDTEIDGEAWATAHWKALSINYRKAPYFEEVAAFVEPLYRAGNYETLSRLNERFIRAICSYLGIGTTITRSSDYELVEGKSERLADIVRQAGGSIYVSGPAAKAYLEDEPFRERSLSITWFAYPTYPEYPQLWGGFEHAVTVLDLMFNCGASSVGYMRDVAHG